MNGKNLRIVGFVSSIIGFIITAFGVYKYEEAKGMVKALGQGSVLFGSTDSTYRGEAIWLSSMNNYRIVIIVGAIILAVGCFFHRFLKIRSFHNLFNNFFIPDFHWCGRSIIWILF